MEKIIEKLNNLFKEFSEEKDHLRFMVALKKYFDFIYSNFILRGIVEDIFNSGSIQMKFVEGVCNSIINSKLDKKYVISPLSLDGSGLYVFQRNILDKLQQKGFTKETLITRDVNGDYFYRGNKMPMDNKTIHYAIFDFLFNSSDNKASYKDINNELAKRGFGMKHNKTEAGNRIRNALKVYKRNKDLVQKIGKVPVIETIPRFGLKLNNPKV